MNIVYKNDDYYVTLIRERYSQDRDASYYQMYDNNGHTMNRIIATSNKIKDVLDNYSFIKQNTICPTL